MRLKTRRILGGLCLVGTVVILGVGAALRLQPVCQAGAPVCAQGIPTGLSTWQTLVIALVPLIAGIVLIAPWRLHWLIRRPPPSDPRTPSRHLPAYPFTPRRSASRHNTPPGKQGR